MPANSTAASAAHWHSAEAIAPANELLVVLHGSTEAGLGLHFRTGGGRGHGAREVTFWHFGLRLQAVR